VSGSKRHKARRSFELAKSIGEIRKRSACEIEDACDEKAEGISRRETKTVEVMLRSATLSTARRLPSTTVDLDLTAVRRMKRQRRVPTGEER